MFDLVICSHILEHVKSDRQAIGELFRVIKPGGLVLLPVPVDWNSEVTEEHEGLTPSERAERYGHADHVRKYGRDYLRRLKEVGFETEVYRLSEAHLAARYRIDIEDPLVIAKKQPYASA
jgi:ubiquinone/menaquinone biosynthesis C-methylase UbiE